MPFDDSYPFTTKYDNPLGAKTVGQIDPVLLPDVYTLVEIEPWTDEFTFCNQSGADAQAWVRDKAKGLHAIDNITVLANSDPVFCGEINLPLFLSLLIPLTLLAQSGGVNPPDNAKRIQGIPIAPQRPSDG